VKDSQSTTIFDNPGNLAQFLGAALPISLGVTKVEARIHFEDFLVCNHHVCYEVTWEEVTTWTPGANGGTTTGPTISPVPTGSSTAVPTPAQKAALEHDFSGQTLLPH
jgi:hypothetical protein